MLFGTESNCYLGELSLVISLDLCTDNVIFDPLIVLFTNVPYSRIHLGHSRRCMLVSNSSFRAPVYIHIPCTFSLQSFKIRVLVRGGRVKDSWAQEALLP